jgi:hypothetical protein
MQTRQECGSFFPAGREYRWPAVSIIWTGETLIPVTEENNSYFQNGSTDRRMRQKRFSGAPGAARMAEQRMVRANRSCLFTACFGCP